MKNILTR